jgi:hypothetical protein
MSRGLADEKKNEVFGLWHFSENFGLKEVF